MDPFTQKILQRAENRSKTFGITKPSNILSTSDSKSPRKGREESPKSSDLKTTKKYEANLINKENVDVAVEINITTNPNVQVQVEMESYDVIEGQAEGKASADFRPESRKRLQRLCNLYSDEATLSSPLSRNENRFASEEIDSNSQSTKKDNRPRLHKLTELADTINNWEDNVDRPKIVDVPSEKEHSKRQYRNVETKNPAQVVASTKAKANNLQWDKSMMESLERQGFTANNGIANAKLTFDYKSKASSSKMNEQKSAITKEAQPSALKQNRETPIVARTNVLEKTSRFEEPRNVRHPKDPTELSLKERMALFEKNKGTALIPKAPLAMSVSKSQLQSNLPKTSTINATMGCKEGCAQPFQQKIKMWEHREQTAELETRKPPKPPIEPLTSVQKAKNRFEQKRLSREEEPSVPEVVDNEPIISNKPSSMKRTSTDSGSKRIRLYPALSDMESDADEEEVVHKSDKNVSFCLSSVSRGASFTESEGAGSRLEESLNHEIMKFITKDGTLNTSNHTLETSSTTSEEEDNLLDDMDDYLNEALGHSEDDNNEEDADDESNGATNSSCVLSSNSFKFQNKKDGIKSRAEVRGDFSPHETQGLTLVHTVSLYRRQQEQATVSTDSPRKQHLQQRTNAEQRDYVPKKTDTDSKLVENRVQELLGEVCKQQQIISQTSQALNLCATTIEFSGSTESVEGERHLLVASHRRQAALNEVQRLQIEGNTNEKYGQTEGRIVIQDIALPLKQDYVKKLAADVIAGHNLVCLIKYNETVLATKSTPTLPGLVTVKFPEIFHLDHVQEDFKITVEIYGMTAQREVLPHEIKYHIAVNKKTAKMFTPKGKKAAESRFQTTPGSSAIRTPALAHYGSIIFSIKELHRNHWTLTQHSSVSPCDGSVSMRVQYEAAVNVDHTGFLTMFEDVSGFGAWHRRWCHLYNNILNYWKYPDDAKTKAPIGSVDLSESITKRVKVAPRDICARLNTLLLECCESGTVDNFQETLVRIRQNDKIVNRYLLSADTKEEREEWCAELNKSLTILRTQSKRRSIHS